MGGTELAAQPCDVGAGPRAPARLFRRETGISFTQWMTRVRRVESIERLTRKVPVTRVTIDLGYAGALGFTQVFGHDTEVPPGCYCANRPSRTDDACDGCVSAAGAMP